MISDLELCVGSPDRPGRNESDRYWRRHSFGIVLNAIAALFIFPALWLAAFGVEILLWQFILLSLATMVASMIIRIKPKKMRRWDAAMRKAKKNVPLRKLKSAWRLYGYGEDGDLAAIECELGHISGDCPLCGAE